MLPKSQMLTYGAIILGAVIVISIIITAVLVRKRRAKALTDSDFVERWREIQSRLTDSTLWPLAIIDADTLLDTALKQKKYKGKTTGERLVAAQKDIPNNEKVWFAHKLRNRLVHEQDVKLQKAAVLKALTGVRDALKSLGVLPS